MHIKNANKGIKKMESAYTKNKTHKVIIFWKDTSKKNKSVVIKINKDIYIIKSETEIAVTTELLSILSKNSSLQIIPVKT